MMGLWTQFPPEVVERHLSVQGAAFRMTYSFVKGDPKNRFWFVLNRHPEKDTELGSLLQRPHRLAPARRRDVHAQVSLFS